MKDKGFTLIELLAVIVVLAVIAIIVTPVITGIIEGTKKEANKQSVNGYVSAVDSAIVRYTFANKGKEYSQTTPNSIEGLNVEYKGTKVTCSRLVIEKGRVKEATCKVDGTDEEITYGSVQDIKYCSASTTLTNGVGVLASAGDKYARGVEYKCDPGDGTTRVFYVVSQDTDNLYLIMDRNIGKTLTNQNEVSTYLSSHTSAWKNVTVSVATAKLVSGNNSWDQTPMTSLPTWLLVNLNCKENICSEASGETMSEQNVLAYWTQDVDTSDETNAWLVDSQTNSLTTDMVDIGGPYGTRPVIKISKLNVE